MSYTSDTAKDLLFDIDNYRKKEKTEEETLRMVQESLKYVYIFAYNQALLDIKNRAEELRKMQH